jgi:hypothetical protein
MTDHADRRQRKVDDATAATQYAAAREVVTLPYDRSYETPWTSPRDPPGVGFQASTIGFPTRTRGTRRARSRISLRQVASQQDACAGDRR